MARLARAVFEGIPHHITQRGNGRAQTFFSDADYRLYRDLLTEHAAKSGVAVWSWVLMPNHVHLILVPPDADALRRCLAPVHRYYAGHVHVREQRSGHFWQGRFGCVAMDDKHLGAALRYVALNPVRARLVGRAADWRWSSIHALGNPKQGDGLTATDAVLERFPGLMELIAEGEDATLSQSLRRAETIGRPLGSEAFIQRLEGETGRILAPSKRGPKARPPGI
jgi:putative transposase